MKKSTILLLLLLAVFFIPIPNIELDLGNKKAFAIDVTRSEGYVAFIVNGDQKPIDNETDTATTCECNGEKVIVHGDGHKTPCQCINSGDGVCRCEATGKSWEPDKSTYPDESVEQAAPEEVKKKVEQQPDITDQASAIELKKTILYFTASWCGPCQRFKATELPKLQQAGLSVGEVRNGVQDDMEIVDVDKHPDLWQTYKKNSAGIPCFVVLDSQRKETFRTSGYATGMHQTLLRAFNAAN